MTLSPSDVEQKTFSTALRGYDLDEVDDFLDQVVATIRELNEQVAAGAPPSPISVEAAAAEAPVEPTPDESAVGRALVAAQETADRIISEAREEAERIVANAKVEAETLISERDQRKAEAEAEMGELSEIVAGVRSQLAVLATAVADRLDEMDAAIGSLPEDDATSTEDAMGEAGVEDEEQEDFTLTEDEGSGDEVEVDEGEASDEDGESPAQTW